MICFDLLHSTEVSFSGLPETVLALGNFDGVHLGHRALLDEAVRCAEMLSENGEPVFPGVWLFRVPPSDLMRSPKTPHLSALEDKFEAFRASGIRYAFLGEFEALATLSPHDFAVRILKESCRCRHAVCGFNYTFGHKGAGTPAMLRTYFDGAVSVVEPVLYGDLPVSSTRIRARLAEGNVKEAAALLGRPYTLRTPVLHGKALGRTLSFPTANQKFPENAVIPKSGIYAVEVLTPDNILHYGVANVGLRPTVEHSDEVNCETFIFDFSGDLYGSVIEVRFIERLRDERKMSGIEELRTTIQSDAENARRIFGLAP